MFESLAKFFSSYHVCEISNALFVLKLASHFIYCYAIEQNLKKIKCKKVLEN